MLSTRQERWLFAAVALTAGTCEEILYCGFLIFNLSDVFPSLPTGWVTVASSAVFALAHLYQG